MNKSRKTVQTQTQSMREKAYTYLLRKIISGDLPAGSALSEVSLAKELGSSRTPLREAVGQLVAEGFVKQIPNRGTVVVQFGREDVAELYDLREALEVYAVEKVTQQTLSRAYLDRLNQLVGAVLLLKEELERSGEARLNAEQMRRFVELDFSFHALLVRAAGNRRIMKVVGDTRVLINIFGMRRRGHDVAQLRDIHRYHHDILDAVARKDGQTATGLMREHIRISKAERLDEYESWEHVDDLPAFPSFGLLSES
jgi:DNA-binding GntR family transcriptional regulator